MKSRASCARPALSVPSPQPLSPQERGFKRRALAPLRPRANNTQMIDLSRYPYLSAIDSPADLRRLPDEELSVLADELRGYLIEAVASSGGHFGAGLGVVELTVALHHVFDTPHDRLVWDVGHQCYPHKILTGRRDRITTIKKKGGLAPFPRREESEYDTFGVGHSSTSISAALGMAIAAQRKGDQRKFIAVIGDGAMTAGMAFEALNHGGNVGANMLVVFNDNGMSISENVGALARMTGRAPSADVSVPSTVFEDMGFHYTGPIDGHDIAQLLKALRALKDVPGPQLLHVITTKGKGYAPAEQAQIEYHAVSPFDPNAGVVKKVGASKPTYSDVFSDWLCDMAADDTRLFGITPAMREGSGLVRFSQDYPDRYFDVAIAEQHAVTLAAGMACEGGKPVVAIYSTFLQRAYDQAVHDVALQNLDVTFAIDRAGVVGPDGATHAGSFDLTFLRCLPNMVIMAPADENECRTMLTTGFRHNGPAAIRYPRGGGPGAAISKNLETMPIGKADLLRRGHGIAILSFGAMLAPAAEVAAELDATLVNMRFVKPLDEALILDLAKDHDGFVTIEDNAVAGGAGSAVAECLAAHGVTLPILHQGLPDVYLEHGTREEVLSEAALDLPGIRQAIRTRFPKAGSLSQASA
jgi:1-deoxy-D-xylulose-5-phosphate synthase